MQLAIEFIQRICICMMYYSVVQSMERLSYYTTNQIIFTHMVCPLALFLILIEEIVYVWAFFHPSLFIQTLMYFRDAVSLKSSPVNKQASKYITQNCSFHYRTVLIPSLFQLMWLYIKDIKAKENYLMASITVLKLKKEN